MMVALNGKVIEKRSSAFAEREGRIQHILSQRSGQLRELFFLLSISKAADRLFEDWEDWAAEDGDELARFLEYHRLDRSSKPRTLPVLPSKLSANFSREDEDAHQRVRKRQKTRHYAEKRSDTYFTSADCTDRDSLTGPASKHPAEVEAGTLSEWFPRSKRCFSTQDWMIARNDSYERLLLEKLKARRAKQKWSAIQVKPCQPHARKRCYWDFLLEDVSFRSKDVRQERRWKLSMAKMIADEAAGRARSTAANHPNPDQRSLRLSSTKSHTERRSLLSIPDHPLFFDLGKGSVCQYLRNHRVLHEPEQNSILDFRDFLGFERLISLNDRVYPIYWFLKMFKRTKCRISAAEETQGSPLKNSAPSAGPKYFSELGHGAWNRLWLPDEEHSLSSLAADLQYNWPLIASVLNAQINQGLLSSSQTKTFIECSAKHKRLSSKKEDLRSVGSRASMDLIAATRRSHGNPGQQTEKGCGRRIARYIATLEQIEKVAFKRTQSKNMRLMARRKGVNPHSNAAQTQTQKPTLSSSTAHAADDRPRVPKPSELSDERMRREIAYHQRQMQAHAVANAQQLRQQQLAAAAALRYAQGQQAQAAAGVQNAPNVADPAVANQIRAQYQLAPGQKPTPAMVMMMRAVAQQAQQAQHAQHTQAQAQLQPQSFPGQVLQAQSGLKAVVHPQTQQKQKQHQQKQQQHPQTRQQPSCSQSQSHGEGQLEGQSSIYMHGQLQNVSQGPKAQVQAQDPAAKLSGTNYIGGPSQAGTAAVRNPSPASVTNAHNAQPRTPVQHPIQLNFSTPGFMQGSPPGGSQAPGQPQQPNSQIPPASVGDANRYLGGVPASAQHQRNSPGMPHRPPVSAPDVQAMMQSQLLNSRNPNAAHFLATLRANDPRVQQYLLGQQRQTQYRHPQQQQQQQQLTGSVQQPQPAHPSVVSVGQPIKGFPQMQQVVGRARPGVSVAPIPITPSSNVLSVSPQQTPAQHSMSPGRASQSSNSQQGLARLSAGTPQMATAQQIQQHLQHVQALHGLGVPMRPIPGAVNFNQFGHVIQAQQPKISGQPGMVVPQAQGNYPLSASILRSPSAPQHAQPQGHLSSSMASPQHPSTAAAQMTQIPQSFPATSVMMTPQMVAQNYMNQGPSPYVTGPSVMGVPAQQYTVPQTSNANMGPIGGMMAGTYGIGASQLPQGSMGLSVQMPGVPLGSASPVQLPNQIVHQPQATMFGQLSPALAQKVQIAAQQQQHKPLHHHQQPQQHQSEKHPHSQHQQQPLPSFPPQHHHQPSHQVSTSPANALQSLDRPNELQRAKLQNEMQAAAAYVAIQQAQQHAQGSQKEESLLASVQEHEGSGAAAGEPRDQSVETDGEDKFGSIRPRPIGTPTVVGQSTGTAKAGATESINGSAGRINSAQKGRVEEAEQEVKGSQEAV